MNKVKLLSFLVIALSLNACQTVPLPPQEDETNDSVVSEKDNVEIKKVKAPVIDDAVTASPVVTTLLEQAQEYQEAGNISAAVSALERAIRIAPRYAESYYELGEIRYAEGNNSQAKALGQKAISLGATGWLRAQSLQLIDNASK